MADGKEMEIEYREGAEISHIEGWDRESQAVISVRILPEASRVKNPGFDVTPGRLVTGLITEKGICEASEEGISSLYSK